MSTHKSLLIIGRPNSGKTTFIAQLYKRLQQADGSILLTATPSNLSVIRDAMAQLSKGLAVNHTLSDTNDELYLPLRMNDQDFQLICPDYGGEQVNTLVQTRRIRDKWQELINASDYWLLFIRLKDIKRYYDINDLGVLKQKGKKKEQSKTGKMTTEEFKISDQAFFIELLQILLYAKGKGVIQDIKSPKLCIVLTCYDELAKTVREGKPRDALKKYAPLLYEYVCSAWDTGARHIVGMSAQGKKLDKNEPDDNYINKGPENWGYMIDSNGAKEKNVSLLLSLLLK